MAKIIWSNVALEDLQAIHEYVSQDSALYAERLIDRIIEKVEVLGNHPRIGRMVPEFNIENIRELIEGNYRIIYRIETEDRIGIARVHHSARLLKGLQRSTPASNILLQRQLSLPNYIVSPQKVRLREALIPLVAVKT